MERRRYELGRGRLSPQAPCQLPVTVARAMAGGLSGMPGTDILLLDSWMQQKGVDGFSLSVSSFHIQQIRVAGCCGDHTEEGSRTPAPQTEPAGVDLGRPGGAVSLAGNITTTTITKRVKERAMEEEKREGEKEENTLPIQAIVV